MWLRLDHVDRHPSLLPAIADLLLYQESHGPTVTMLVEGVMGRVVGGGCERGLLGLVFPSICHVSICISWSVHRD